VLANSYIKEVPAVSMTFKQKNAGLDSLQVGRVDAMWCAVICCAGVLCCV